MVIEQKLVRDLMTVGVPTCKWDTPIVDIARFLLEKNVEAMCVLDGEGHGIGVVGGDELVWAYAREGYESLTAEDIMSEGVPELSADIPLAIAAQIMKDKGIRIAYMLHNSAGIIYPAAFISYRHILRHMAAKDENELKDLGLAAERKSPLEQFIERRDEARRKAGTK
ncbi:MAG: CBS domain-containing protein [Chloroflexi bacterium]|nr:CBS domain-containing protein [Chloroflexota bacterium]MBI3167226.1 CBS domain-containing protein [Chloroflexota bacterium]